MKQKTIVLINSSYRKKSTYNLLKQIEKELSEMDYKTVFLNLGELNIASCKGCEVCLRKGQCIIKDDFLQVMETLKTADGVVLGSPVYLRNVSGSLKNLFDRSCQWYHRPELVGIPVLSVLTTAFSGIRQTKRYIQDVLVQWASMDGGSIVRNVIHKDDPVQKKELRRFLKLLNSPLSNYHPSLKEIIEFNTQKILAEKVLENDRLFWEKKEWLKRPYFFSCRINSFKRLTGFLYYRLLDRVITVD